MALDKKTIEQLAKEAVAHAKKQHPLDDEAFERARAEYAAYRIRDAKEHPESYGNSGEPFYNEDA